MPLIVGENSYVTLAEAEAYFAERFGTSQFTNIADASTKESGLRMATVLLDAYCVWAGAPTASTQTLQFPRDGATTVPDAIKNAQYELAEAIAAEGTGIKSDDSALKKMSVDVISFEWQSDSATSSAYYNRLVKAYLDPYCASRAYGNSVIRV